MTKTSSNPAVWAGIKPPDDHELAWKIVAPDLRSYRGFQWPASGVVIADAPNADNHNACPVRPGDGLCLAKTWYGAAAGGQVAITGLAIAYRPDDILGADDDKLRVSRCRVLAILDLQRLLREGYGRKADLSGADLSWANLSGADLSWANLSGADLSWANLREANLRWALRETRNNHTILNALERLYLHANHIFDRGTGRDWEETLAEAASVLRSHKRIT